MKAHFASFVALGLTCLFALMVGLSGCSSPQPTTGRNTVAAPATGQFPQDTFQYLAHDGTPRTAWLEPVEVKFEGPTNIVNTIDPDWRVRNPDGTTPRDKKITFKATDTTERKMWVEATYNPAGNWVVCKFKNAKVDNSDERPAQEDIWLLDHGGNPFRLTIPRISGNPPLFFPKFSIG